MPDRNVGMLWPVNTTAAQSHAIGPPGQTAMMMPAGNANADRDAESRDGQPYGW